MTNKQHPITPPPELLQQWLGAYFGTTVTGEVSEVELALATQAARWGADQQLDQDAKWLDTNALFSHNLTITPSGGALRQVMRPKPPSLKEQALEELSLISISPESGVRVSALDTIRRALEALPE